MARIWLSSFVSYMTDRLVTIKMVGTMQIVIKVSFHWTAKARMKAETKVATPWIVWASFSEMPLLTLLVVVVTCSVTDPTASSK